MSNFMQTIKLCSRFAGIWIIASIAVPFALHVYYKWPATTLLPVPEGGDDKENSENNNLRALGN